MAWKTTGNYDRESWEIASRVALHGGNIYAETSRYGYSPVWFWLLGALAKFQTFFPFFEFKFLFRTFLTVVDIATCFVLMALAGPGISQKTRTALFYYLNPVSFLLTGYHGQFDNLAIFFFLLGLLGYFLSKSARPVWLWFWTTAGMITKHIIFYELLIVLQFVFKKRGTRVIFFIISCALFALSFSPYWAQGRQGIVRNVLLYTSYAVPYGLSALHPPRLFTVVFVMALFIYPYFIRSKDLVAQALLGALFFLVFTTGVGVQYFVLPIALGALRPSRGFFVYSAVTSCYLLGSYFNLGIRAFSWMPVGAVWFAACYWWINEQRSG